MIAWLRHHRSSVVVFALALVWFLPGIWWGLPVYSATERMSAWGTDELGPWGAVDAILAVLRIPRNDITPQYPLAHFFVQAISVWPYYLPYYIDTMYPSIANRLGLPHGEVSRAVLMLLHRVPSLLMAAGTVVVAQIAGRQMAGTAAGWMAAAAVATIGPMLYYARTSNVDVGALFWTALAIPFALRALRDGLSRRNAVALGACAGLAIATKDQQYAFFLGLGVVLLTTQILDRRGSGEWAGWWRGPLLALGVATGVYLALSGIVLLPDWFFRHVRYLVRVPDPSTPQAILAMMDAYHSNPATPAGYLALGMNAGAKIVAAVGLPIVILAMIGFMHAARIDRRLLALLAVPPLFLVMLVFVPVRFVLPRYLLPVELVVCMFAALAVGAAEAVPGGKRAAIRALAIAGLAWAGARGADITWQMLRDSRLEAGAWLERNLQPGDSIGYYAAPLRLPRLPVDVTTTMATGQYSNAYKNRKPTAETPPTFIISIPQLGTEPVHEWSLPEATFHQLLDGSSGYQQVFAYQSPALWPRPLLTVSWINPPVRIFARKDVVSRLPGPVRIELPDPR
jgi:4-amino-4-deoxy-L-arabinose transferase-like glycosyltransferase